MYKWWPWPSALFVHKWWHRPSTLFVYKWWHRPSALFIYKWWHRPSALFIYRWWHRQSALLIYKWWPPGHQLSFYITNIIHMSTFVSRRKYVYNSRLGFSILYKNAARSFICVSWQFTYTWETLAWSINSQGMLGPIELV